MILIKVFGRSIVKSLPTSLCQREEKHPLLLQREEKDSPF
jgi:hypothetical protein